MTARTDRRAGRSVSAQLDSLGANEKTRRDVDDLAERIYGHMLRVIDLDRLFGLEQCVWSELDRLKVHDDEGELATSLLAEALHRVGGSPERQGKVIPDGITEEEVIAAEFDEACLMCHHDAEDVAYRMSGRCCEHLSELAEDKAWRALQAQAAKQWRATNADALRRFDAMMAQRGSPS